MNKPSAPAGLVWALLVFVPATTTVAATVVRPGFSFNDDFTTTRVSGVAGDAVSTTTYGSTYAVFGVSWTERRDRPCSLTAIVDHIYDNQKDYHHQEIHRCGDRGPKEASRLTVDFLKDPVKGAYFFATSLEVCLNPRGTRVKGFRLGGVSLNSRTGRLDPITAVDPTVWFPTRNNCEEGRDGYKVWQPAAVCPPGSIAVALVGHYDATDPPRSLTGVGLRCRRLEFTDENGTRPVS